MSNLETLAPVNATPATQAPATQAPAKAKEKAKGASKAKGATQAPAKLAFRLLPGFRPASGAALYAHTKAVLSLTGMDKGKAIPRATVRAAMGDTAVAYHLNHSGAFDATEEGLRLSVYGESLFGELRKVDPELLAAYRAVLSTGKPDGNIVKNASGIKGIDA